MAATSAPATPQSKGPHLGSELFDAIVQAADPKHPDHSAWQERYGLLSNRSSPAPAPSGSKRDKMASPRTVTPTSLRKSFDHSDAADRRRTAARRAGLRDSPAQHIHEPEGSDADDPMVPRPHSPQGRYTPVRGSFEGSLRSFRSTSASSLSQRNRNRRLRDPNRPKPLIPPIPPPRVTSSTNWQARFGSPSLPDLASSLAAGFNHASSSSNTSDNHDFGAFPLPSQRLPISPSAPASLRIAHPYASPVSYEKQHDQRPLPLIPFASAVRASNARRQHFKGPDSASALQAGFELREGGPRFNRDHKRQQNSTSMSSQSSHIASHAQASPASTISEAVRHDKSFLHLPGRTDGPRESISASVSKLLSSQSSSSKTASPEISPPPRTSMSSVRLVPGPEAPTLDDPSGRSPWSPPSSPPAVPPKSMARRGQKATGFIPRVTVPELPKRDTQASRHSLEARKIDLNVFPLRRDDEFRANDHEFEISDDTEAEDHAGRSQLPSTPSAYTQNVSTSNPVRGAGVVRRSLDSIISPFRAGLLNSRTSSKPSRNGVFADSNSNLTLPQQEPVAAEGRRSFSDSRFARPFLPRGRNATLGRQARPLSKVLDRPEDELAEGLPPSASQPMLSRRRPSHPAFDQAIETANRSDLATSQGKGSEQNAAISHWKGTSKKVVATPSYPDISDVARDTAASAGRPDKSLPSISSARSLASTFSRSTSNLHGQGDPQSDAFARNGAISTPQQASKGKFGGFLSKVKGSITPKGTPKLPSHEFAAFPGSPPTQDSLQGHGSPASAAAMSPPAGSSDKASQTHKKSERPFRNRVRSLTSGLSSSRSKDDDANVPAVPSIPRQFADPGRQEPQRAGYGYSSPQSQMPTSLSATFASPDAEQTRSVWEESPQMPSSSSFASAEKASRSFGRLLRKKKTQEDLDTVLDTFVPLPPKITHPDAAVEAAPRSSMSSARGFAVKEPADAPVPVGQMRTTIRKTLSPPLLSDAPQASIDATLVDGELGSVGHAEALAPDVVADDNARKGDDVAEELSEIRGDEPHFRSPLGRFIRSNQPGERLSRVEELSERLSYISDRVDSNGKRASTSMPTSPNPRSFGEHRSVRRIASGDPGGQSLPPTLELAPPRDVRPKKISLDILRSYKKQDAAADSPASEQSVVSSSPAVSRPATTPKTPSTPGLTDQLTPSWRSTSFSTGRTGRTSFSQDRDRAPVASPISPPLPTMKGTNVGQAIKKLGIKGRSKKVGKGIGPADVIILGVDDEAGADEVGDSRLSMSTEHRPSFGGGARPSFSNLSRASFGGSARPSFDATGHGSLAPAEVSQVEANGLIASPVDPSFGHRTQSEMAKSTTSLNRTITESDGHIGGAEVAGLGIGAVQWSAGMPLHKGEGVEAAGSVSTSDGTFTSQGIPTPENGSLYHSCSSQLPLKLDSCVATTPLACESVDSSTGTGTQANGQLKSAEMQAFEDMLGRFPQQQKSLLQDISARVAKTPIPGGSGSSSQEDVVRSAVFATQSER